MHTAKHAVEIKRSIFILYNKICPNFGTEQVGLNLSETNGSFVCSNCKKHFVVEGFIIKEVKDEQSKDNRTENHA